MVQVKQVNIFAGDHINFGIPFPVQCIEGCELFVLSWGESWKVVLNQLYSIMRRGNGSSIFRCMRHGYGSLVLNLQ